MLKPKVFLGTTILMLFVMCIVGCGQPEKPEGTITAGELLREPIYNTEVKVYGRVKDLGKIQCLCFFLTSGGDSIQVWYDMMVENDGTERPSVSVMQIQNGDMVIVTGELKDEGGTHYSKDDFWAKSIVIPQ